MVSKILRRRGTHPSHATTKTTSLVDDLHRRHGKKKDRTGAAASTNTSYSSSLSSSSVVSGNVVVLDWPKVVVNNKRRQDHRDETDDDGTTGDDYDDSIECYYLDPSSGTDTDYYGDGDGDQDYDTPNNDNDLTNVKDQKHNTRDRQPEHEQQEQETAEKDEESETMLVDGASLDEETGRDRPEIPFEKKKKTKTKTKTKKKKKVTNVFRKKEADQPSPPATPPPPPPLPLASKSRFGWPMKRLFRGRNDSIANDNNGSQNNKTEEESREKIRRQHDDQIRERKEKVNLLSSQDDLDWSTEGDTNGGGGGGGIWTMMTTTMMTIPSLLQKMSRLNDSNEDRNAAAVDSSNRSMAKGRTNNILQSLVHVYVDEHIDDGDDDGHDDDGVSCLSDGLYSAWNDSSLRSIHSYRHHHHPCHLNNSLRQQLSQSEPPTPKQSLECVLPNVLYFDDRHHAQYDDGDNNDGEDAREDQSLSQKTDNDDDGRRYETITTKDKFRLLFPTYRNDDHWTEDRVDDSGIERKREDGRNDVNDDSREPVTESRMDDDQLLPEMRSLATDSPSISTSDTNDTGQHQDERTVAASEVTMNTYFGGFNNATMDFAGQDLVDKIEYMVYPQTDDGDDMNGTSSLLSFVWSRLIDIPKTFFWNQTVNIDESNEDDTSLEISSAAGRDIDGDVDVDNDSKVMALDGFDLSSQVGSSQRSASENDSWRMSNGWLDWPSEVVTSIATELGARTTNMIGELDVPSCGVFLDIPNRVKHAIEKTFVGASGDEGSDHGSSSATAVTNSSKMPVDSTHDKNVESITLSDQRSKTSTTLANNETISTFATDRITPPTDESSSDGPKSSSSSSTESSAMIVDADDSTPKQDLGLAPMDKVSDPVRGDDDDGDGDGDDEDHLFEDAEELASGDNETTSLRSIWDDFDPVQMLKWWSLYPNNDDGDDGDY